MLKKTIYMAAIAAVLAGAPYAYSQTLSARGVNGPANAVDQVSAADLSALQLIVDDLVLQLQTLTGRVDGHDTDLTDVQDDVTNINTQLTTINTNLTNIGNRLTNVENALGALTTLDQRVTALENADPAVAFQNMDVQVVSNTLCRKARGKYTVRATCPTGYTLLSCSGGSGDLDESYEGYDIRPLNKTTCEAIVKEPACYQSSEITARTNLYAYCFKLGS